MNRPTIQTLSPGGALRAVALVMGALLVVGLHAGSAVGAAPDWRLSWEDSFEVLDANRWEAVTTFEPTNDSRQAYLASQVSVDNGNLVLISENEPAGSLPYRSGLVKTREFQQYGRWEVRAKLPTTAGMWPAIWLLPDTGEHPWPSGGEIDIMENRGNQPTLTSSAFHYGTNSPYKHDFVYGEQQTATLGGALTRYDEGFHTYAVDWTPEYLRFYVDGVNHYTVHDEDVEGFLSQSTQPMQLVINTAVGGTFLPDPDETTVWPQEFRIDSVRVFEATGQRGEVKLTNSGFEHDGGGLSDWTVFGNELFDNPNVRVANEAVRTGKASLKVFGTFQEGANQSGISQGITVGAGDEVTAELHALVRSADELGGENRIALKIDFYSRFGAKHGSDAMLREEILWIADATTATDQWAQQELSALAPEGAEEARLSIVFEQPGYAGGAIHIDDIVFEATPAVARADFNFDGSVNAADYTVWRDTRGATGSDLAADADRSGRVDAQDLAIWSEHFGSQVEQGAGRVVPEPGATTLVLGAGVATLSSTRNRSNR